MAHIADVAIVGQSMVASLGHDVVTCCAAARASITRPSSFEYQVRDPDEDIPDFLTVHAVPLLTKGFSGSARWLRMVEGAMLDMLTQFPDKPWLQSRSAFFVSIPSWMRVHTGGALLADEEERALFEEKAHKAAAAGPAGKGDTEEAKNVIAHAAKLADWGVVPEVHAVFVSGNTGTAEAMAEAMAELRSGNIEFAFVLSVDSWMEEETLTWLDAASRLKTPMQPVGLQPGEAGVLLLLELERRALHRRAAILASVAAVEFAQEERFLLTGQVPIGRSLASLLDSTAAAAGWGPNDRPWVISDHNGETYRATEWANCLYHLIQRGDFYQESAVWFPAVSVGDTGAASGAVAVCMATRAFARNYAPHSVAVIASSSDGPQRSAIVLRKP